MNIEHVFFFGRIVCVSGEAAKPVDRSVVVSIKDHSPGIYEEEFSYTVCRCGHPWASVWLI